MEKPDQDKIEPENFTVLVAENEALIRMDIVDTLTEGGLRVMEAASGTEAVELIDDPDHVALVVTDINIPGIDGIDVSRHARSRHPDIPVLFVSARPDLLTAPRTPRPYSYLSKPFSIFELRAKVSALLAARSGK